MKPIKDTGPDEMKKENGNLIDNANIDTSNVDNGFFESTEENEIIKKDEPGKTNSDKNIK